MANYRTAFTGAQIDELLANIRDGKVPVAASAPATAVEGQIYYNSGDDTLYVYDGSEWTSLGYVPPVGGIPKSDLSEDVRTSLGKADTALQTHQDISGKEDTGNKVTSLSSASTDTQYPSAKCVYDIIGNIETLLAAL